MSIQLENTRFTECVNQNPQGSTFLGYLYGEQVVEDGIAPGEDFRMGLPDIEVRLTVNGDERIDFPADDKVIRGEERRVARYFTASKQSRDLLTKLVFALPEVKRAVRKGKKLRKSA